MNDSLCQVIQNTELQAGYFRLFIEKPFESFRPGQFCMLRLPNTRETLLRRPFSLCREGDDHFEIVYKVVGPVTRAMAGLGAGQELCVLGPLGQGVEWSGFERVIGIAGGYGIAPMLGLAHQLAPTAIEYQVYYGARSKTDLLLVEDFNKADIPLHITTEDGTAGSQGQITDLLVSEDHSDKKTLWFVCGPHGLLRAVAELADSKAVKCRVSMEEYMGCGIGVCLGCVVPTPEGEYRRSCVEGPVMDSQRVRW